MARETQRLSARAAANAEPGLHADGGGLYLRVEPTGARRWVCLFRFDGKRCEMGFGPLADLSLADARSAAQQVRQQVRAGIDPIAERRRQRAAVKALPFGALADQVVQDLTPQWKNPKVAQQWATTLTVDAASLRPRLVDQLTTEHVLEALKPIWTVKPETAARLRGRIERVLDVAKVRGMRSGENPARWKGHLALLLPRRKKERKHHAALPYAKIAAFCGDLRVSESVSAVALDFTILTVARTSETRFARGPEFDLKDAIWTVPAERMKSGREHRVPLSPPALAIAKQRIEICGSGYLFPGLARHNQPSNRATQPISNMAMAKMLKLLGYSEFTVHGFRSTFRDWAGDRTTFARELIEAAMAHIMGDEAEQAYRRSDALERRRQLMDAWATYCEQHRGAKIVAHIWPEARHG